VEALTAESDPGFDLFATAAAGPLRQIAERGAWRLVWSGDPEGAVPLVEEAFRRARE
jgi:hypothetical protein